MPLEHSRVFKSTSKSFGAAFQARSLDLDGAVSPLLAFDDFRVGSSPFRPHPHAGFSAVSCASARKRRRRCETGSPSAATSPSAPAGFAGSRRGAAPCTRSSRRRPALSSAVSIA